LDNFIPLSVPSLNGNELKYTKECIETEWVSSAGKFVELFEEKIADYTKSKFAIACVNGTSALQTSLRLSGVQPEDEVIAPSLTFIAPINSILYNNATPIFMDSDKFCNIDENKTIDFINNNTVFKDGYTYNKYSKKRISAIIPVHIWGNAVKFEALFKLCQERNITVVEDASESLGTSYSQGKFKNRHTGTVGKFGCISFNGNKIITTGGGGMILTDSDKLADKAKYLTTQAKDDPVNYIHEEVGYNFRLTNIQAALGVAQLEQLDTFLKRKKEINNFYKNEINKIEGLSILDSPEYSSNNHWINILQIDTKLFKFDKNQIMKYLNENRIQTRPIWKLNHLQTPFKNFENYKIDNAHKLVDRCLCLPSSANLLNSDLERIAEALRK
tara:strand:+ start:693 stop:1853 length:1161 start_codon:yes stop_codon:yes gene_type:complete